MASCVAAVAALFLLLFVPGISLVPCFPAVGVVVVAVY